MSREPPNKERYDTPSAGRLTQHLPNHEPHPDNWLKYKATEAQLHLSRFSNYLPYSPTMDSTTSQQREIVFCHQCENEWYKDEHGLICPNCESDIVEIVENIPPEEDIPSASDDHFDYDDDDDNIPDPDVDDIEGLQWEQTGPGRYRIRGRYTTDVPLGPDGQPQLPPQGQGQGQGGFISVMGSMLQGMLGQAQAQEMQRATGFVMPPQNQPQAGYQQTPSSPQQQQQTAWQEASQPNPEFGSPPPPRPASAPGFAEPSRATTNNGTFVRHGQGQGWSYTIATSTGGSNNLNQIPNLFPRNANAPQPFHPQPDHIEHMLSQIFGNIGAVPGRGGMQPQQPDGNQQQPHPFHGGNAFFGGGPFIIGGPNGQMHTGGGPSGTAASNGNAFDNFLNFLGGGMMPGNARPGDGVYTQEALDRIITQLMEQHQSGNAPGPASEAAIKSLPTKTICEADLSDPSGKAECTICMDETPLGTQVTVLPCGHWFHGECIRLWLGEHDTCPHCRQGIMPKPNSSAASDATAGPQAQAQAETARSPGQQPLNDGLSPQFTRTSLPGAYPFPNVSQSSAGGDDGPARRNSDGFERRRSSAATGSGATGMFGRMRDAFGRSGSGGQG